MSFAKSTLVAALYAGSASAGTVNHGKMSMWSSTPDTLVGYKSEGSACKYADKDMGGLSAPTAQTPYIKAKKYCAVNRGMFGGGEICGACYRISYNGDQEQGLGRPGSDVIQVVDSGSWATFDCHMSAFNAITDYTTGFFPITYEKVPCETAAGGPVVGVLGSTYYVSKLVFNNLQYPVKTASVSVGGQEFDLKLIGGWWYVWTGGVQGKVVFKVIKDNDEVVTISGCFGGWQNRRTGDGCSNGDPQLKAALQVAAASLATQNLTETVKASSLRGFAPAKAETLRSGLREPAAHPSSNETVAVFLP